MMYEKYKNLFLLLPFLLMAGAAPQAEAGVFGLFGPKRVKPCNGFFCLNRNSSNNRGRFVFSSSSGCRSGNCSSPGVSRSVSSSAGNGFKFEERIDPKDFVDVDSTRALAAAKGKLFEKDEDGRVRYKLKLDRAGNLIRERVDVFGRPIHSSAHLTDRQGRPLYLDSRGKLTTASHDRNGRSLRRAGGHKTFVDRYDPTNLELLTFYMDNKQKFKDAVVKARRDFLLNPGNAAKNKLIKAQDNLRIVERYTAGNIPAQERGSLDIDLVAGVDVPEGYDKYSDADVQRKSANFLMNLLNVNSRDKIFPANGFAGGLAQYRGLNRIIDRDANGENIVHTKLANPYACSIKEKLAAPIRLDWGIMYMTQPKAYYALTSTPNNLRDLAAKFGADDEKLSPIGRKIVVPGLREEDTFGDGSGVVNGDPRVIEFQQTRASGRIGQQARDNSADRVWAISYDGPNNDHSALKNKARNPLYYPFDFNVAASEIIAKNPNGMMFAALANGAGVLQNEAPASIALYHGRGKHPRGGEAGSVNVILECLECHTNFYNGPNWQDKEGYSEIDIFKYLSPSDKRKAQSFYTSYNGYKSRMKRYNDNYRESLKRLDSLVTANGKEDGKIMPLLPDWGKKYTGDLSYRQAVREILGGAAIRRMSEGQIDAAAEKLKNFLLGSGGFYLPGVNLNWRTDYVKKESAKEKSKFAKFKGKKDINYEVIPRNVFEQYFCELRAATWPTPYDRSSYADNSRYGKNKNSGGSGYGHSSRPPTSATPRRTY